MRRLRGGAAAAVVLICAATAAGCTEQTTGSGAGSAGAGPTAGGGAANGGAALAVAESLTVKGRAPKTGYERDRFGAAWADTDSNSCDTRVISMLRRSTEAFAQLMQGMVSCAY